MREPTAGRGREPLWIRLLFRVYGALVSFVVWAGLVPWTLAQIARGRARWTDLDQWLGRAAPGPSAAPRLVIHAVSAGETASAIRLIAALRRQRPAWTVVMTVGTRDGQISALTAAQRIDTITAVVRLPWDRDRALRRWLQRLDAAAFVVVEPEYWPNLYRVCGRLGVPLLLANARVYPRDIGRYRLVRPFMRAVLGHTCWIGAESDAARAALGAIGAPDDRIEVTGSLKLDSSDPSSRSDTARSLSAQRSAGAITIVGGSTHAADELALLSAFGILRLKIPSLKLVLAPRHAHRARRVLADAQRIGYRGVLSSHMTESEKHLRDSMAPWPWDILVVDRFGELQAIYAEADIAVVGGTLAEVGGHNVAEPARLGRAVVVGPHVEHIRSIVDILRAADAIVCLDDTRPETLRDALAALLDDSGRRTALGDRARQAVAVHSGAADRSAERLVQFVELRAGAVTVVPGNPEGLPPPVSGEGLVEATL